MTYSKPPISPYSKPQTPSVGLANQFKTLIDLTSDLTSLKYGIGPFGDRPGGGSSGEPYIQFPIEGNGIPINTENFYILNRNGLNYPIRGGQINNLGNGLTTTPAGLIDAQRIQAFLNDNPKGKSFVDKQKGLQLTNPLTQVPTTINFSQGVFGNSIVPVTQTYNSQNTLAQVQSQGTGVHFNYSGVSPNIYESLQNTYEYIAGNYNNNTATNNRLAILYTLKVVGNTTNYYPNVENYLNNNGIDPSTITKLGISNNNQEIFNYQGGPGSVYGIGSTIIRRYTDTQPIDSSNGYSNSKNNVIYSTIGLTYKQLTNQSLTSSADNLNDFRSQLLNAGKPGYSPFSNYLTDNIQNKFYNNPIGNKDLSNYSNSLTSDKLNLYSPFYYSPDNNKNTKNPWTNGGNEVNDLIKFGFECLDNDNLGASIALIFRAFLEGSITDTNQANYNTFKYLGRGETFRTYQGFDRQISFSFKIAVQSRSEMAPLYTKLNTLISQVYPDYGSKGIMRGSVVKLTIGDYLNRVPGFLENVNVTIDNKTPWEIALDPNGKDSDVAQLPHVVTVQCGFRPIMDQLPSRITFNNKNFKIIAGNQTNDFGKNYGNINKERVIAMDYSQPKPIPIFEENIQNTYNTSNLA